MLDLNRVMYVDENIHGTGQNNVRVRVPWNTEEEYWVWNEETQTIRSATNHKLVLSLEDAKKIEAGNNVVVKPYTGAADQVQYYDKTNHHMVNWANKGICMGVMPTTNPDDLEGANVLAGNCTGSKNVDWYPWYEWQAPGPHWNRQVD